MQKNYIDIINYISTFSCIIPLIIYWYNFKKIGNQYKLISIYLTFCFLIEAFLTYTYANSIKVKNVGVSFVLIELFLMGLFFWDLFDYMFKRILIFVFSFYVLLYFMRITNYSLVSINLFLGGSKVILILVGIVVLLKSFSVILPDWKKLFNYSILQYSFFGLVISSFASFFVEHKEYLGAYNLINSFNNFLFYLLVTLSMLKCKKLYS